jgi:undecaprenyl-diphosphatase
MYASRHFALVLFLADRAKTHRKKVTFSNAFIVRFHKPLLCFGILRSGYTISTSVLLGNDKTKAARFSFLMVVQQFSEKLQRY